MNEDLNYRLYVLAEITYERENQNISKEDLYPVDWYSTSNYSQKIEIIEEALNEKVLIKDTKKYQDSIEGVKLTSSFER